MNEDIGRKVKELRLFYRISQVELCEDICNQSFISKLEKGLVHPSANVLSMIAERLGVHAQYFFDPFADVTKVNYMYKVIDYIAKNMDRSNYKEVLEMVETEKNNPLFHRSDLKQYFLWRKGICLFHLYENETEALECIDEALTLSPTTGKSKSEREMDILLSKAIIYSMIGNHKRAEIEYEVLLKEVGRHPYLINQKLELRIYYNYSKNKYDQEKFKSSFKIAEEGIKLCLQTDSLYMLGEFYYQSGQSGWTGGQISKKEAFNLFEKAKSVFVLRDNMEFAEAVAEEMEQIK